MKRCRSLVVLALIVVTASVATLGRCGDEAAAPAALVPAVAVVDLSHLFENYAPFKARMAEIAADAQRRQEEFKKEFAEIDAIVQRAREVPEGSPEHRAIIARVEKWREGLADVERLGRPPSFQQRQAKVYHETYELFRREIVEYAKANRIAVVIRTNLDPIDENNPQDVLQGINVNVVWIAGGGDITRIILQRINDKERRRTASAARKE